VKSSTEIVIIVKTIRTWLLSFLMPLSTAYIFLQSFIYEYLLADVYFNFFYTPKERSSLPRCVHLYGSGIQEIAIRSNTIVALGRASSSLGL
jgi:hypothetical protein